MFVEFIKLKLRFHLSLSHTYNSQCYSTHETTTNSDWPITDYRMRKKAFTVEVRYSSICERDF